MAAGLLLIFVGVTGENGSQSMEIAGLAHALRIWRLDKNPAQVAPIDGKNMSSIADLTWQVGYWPRQPNRNQRRREEPLG